ncbi:MAG TPA: hypothetical protein VEI49_04240 [Terriglobales bacterium]|nr:hypothetical protein [Terriglobales bacterium]
MGTLPEIAGSVFVLAFFAALIALFIKESRPPQPLETQLPATPHAFANAVVALISPGISVLVFYFGVWIHFTNNRIFDGLIALPLVIGAYCGRRVFRATEARLPVRLAGLLAVIVCVPSALVFLLITVFGVG